jgi:hypothetical protein
MRNYLKIIFRFLLLALLDVLCLFYFTIGTATEIAGKLSKDYRKNIITEYFRGIFFIFIISSAIYYFSGIRKGELFPDVLILVFNLFFEIVLIVSLLNFIL